MPISKLGDKWVVNGIEYDTEEKAELAYKTNLALALGVKEEKPKKIADKKK